MKILIFLAWTIVAFVAIPVINGYSYYRSSNGTHKWGSSVPREVLSFNQGKQQTQGPECGSGFTRGTRCHPDLYCAGGQCVSKNQLNPAYTCNEQTHQCVRRDIGIRNWLWMWIWMFSEDLGNPDPLCFRFPSPHVQPGYSDYTIDDYRGTKFCTPKNRGQKIKMCKFCL